MFTLKLIIGKQTNPDCRTIHNYLSLFKNANVMKDQIYFFTCVVVTKVFTFMKIHVVCFVKFSKSLLCIPIKIVLKDTQLLWLSGLSSSLRTKVLLVQFPIRAHAWVVGLVPGRRQIRGNHTLMFLFLSFSLSSLVSKNK